MLKSTLFYLMTLVTAVRLALIVYLLAGASTNLPTAVFVATSVTVLHGLLLIFKKFVGSVRLGQLMAFYIILTIAIIFNLFYVANNVPVNISIPETLVVGTFLDILINIAVICLCIRRRRSRFVTVGGIQ